MLKLKAVINASIEKRNGEILSFFGGMETETMFVKNTPPIWKEAHTSSPR
jgi:hypothetical protein